MATERDQVKVGYESVTVECRSATSKDECMHLLDVGDATMTTLDAGEVFVGGRYHSLVPIAQEILSGGFKHYYGVAVVKKNTLTDAFSMQDLRGKRACFAGVQAFAGWMLPISTLLTEGVMEITDCNNHVKSATAFFGESCVINILSDRYNPIGDNSDKLCQLCTGKIPGGRCTYSDPYGGYDGAFRCLLEAGDIAFLKHTTVPELLKYMNYTGKTTDDFELFCKDGSRKPISEYLNCNWGKIPSDAIVTSSAVFYEQRILYQKFLKAFAEKYANSSNPVSYFGQDSFNRPEFDPYGNRINYEDRENQQQFDQDGNRLNNQDQDRFRQQPFDQDRNRSNENRYNQYDQFGNRANDESRNVDQFGNRGRFEQNQPQYDVYGNPIDNSENRNQDQNFDQYRNRGQYDYDQYGNRVSRFRRQNGDYDQANYDYRNRDGNRYDENENPQENNYYEVFKLFESVPRYGEKADLLFSDSATDFAPVPENLQVYSNFLGDTLSQIMAIRHCPVNRMTLCITSDAEENKCIKMRTAVKAQLLKPEMDCYKANSQIHCMQAIRAGTADVTVLDASDVYTAGLKYDLIPFISEVYNLDEAEYYVVAVAKESDPDTELTYLRTKNTCHGGINTAAGWVYPLAFLISNGWIRPYGCNSIRAAAEYFSKSCAPGALSTEYNTQIPYDNMCDLCHGSSYRACRRDASEDYYGHTGAFRCLVEGGGHVAFVKHTTVTENTGGKKREWWTRDNLNDDYELLCTDGTRAEINEYKRCNLGKVKANAIVTRGGYGYNETQIKTYINLFLYAQTFYGRKTADEFSFSMFTSAPPYADLIFQDATTQLQIIEPSKRHYAEYVGSDFLRARRIVDCHASASIKSISFLVFVLSLFTMILVPY